MCATLAVKVHALHESCIHPPPGGVQVPSPGPAAGAVVRLQLEQVGCFLFVPGQASSGERRRAGALSGRRPLLGPPPPCGSKSNARRGAPTTWCALFLIVDVVTGPGDRAARRSLLFFASPMCTAPPHRCRCTTAGPRPGGRACSCELVHALAGLRPSRRPCCRQRLTSPAAGAAPPASFPLLLHPSAAPVHRPDRR